VRAAAPRPSGLKCVWHVERVARPDNGAGPVCAAHRSGSKPEDRDSSLPVEPNPVSNNQLHASRDGALALLRPGRLLRSSRWRTVCGCASAWRTKESQRSSPSVSPVPDGFAAFGQHSRRRCWTPRPNSLYRAQCRLGSNADGVCLVSPMLHQRSSMHKHSSVSGLAIR
jgi:hypothetical protein